MNLRLFLATACVLFAFPADAAEDFPLRLSVSHGPNPVRATLRVDPDSQARTYRWVFVTEVRNESQVPLRILRFGALTRYGGGWSSIDELSYGTAEFTEWYDDGALVREGWIQPGEAARDSTNWNRSSFSMSLRAKWVYIAEDADGNPVMGECEIERIPYVEVDPEWGLFGDGQLVPIEGEIDYGGRGNPGYAQIRIRRFENTALPQEIVELEDEEAFSIHVAPSGLFQLELYAPGYERLSLPILLEEGDPGLRLTIHPTPHDLVVGAESVADFDSGHAQLRTLMKLSQEVEVSKQAFSRAYRTHMKEHATTEGFGFDRGALTERLRVAMSAEEPLPVRQFAAWSLAVLPAPIDSSTALSILKILPPESTIWATDPGRVRGFAANAGRGLDRDLMQEFLQGSPDRGVQAFVLVGQALAARYESRYEEVLRLHERLSSEYADIHEVRTVLPRLVQSDAIRPGKPVPAFEVESIDDDSIISSESLRGRAYLVHFWASWCAPCRAEMPEIEAAQAEFGGDAFTVLSLSLDRDIDALQSYRRQHYSMAWPNAWLSQGSESALAREFDVLGIPYLVLVDDEGMIIAAGGALRGDRLHAELAELLGSD